MISLTVTLDVHEQHLDAFRAAIAENALRSFSDEPGCVRFDVNQVVDNPTRFVFYELYADRRRARRAPRSAPLRHMATSGRRVRRRGVPDQHDLRTAHHTRLERSERTIMKILVLPGDGIGPEITDATLRVLEIADRDFQLGLEFEFADIGLKSLAEQGTTLPTAVLERIPEVDGVILGPVSHYDYPAKQEGGFNPSAELRVQFELFANVRPCRSRAGLEHPAQARWT